MILHHGTTHRRAQRICQEGFLPKKPSRRVWFAEGRGYALRRARTQARRRRDRPVVLTCQIDLERLKKRLGRKRVFCRGGCIAIGAKVGVTALRSYPGSVDQPASPDDLAEWVNRILHRKPHKGVSRKHAGIDRLSKWVVSRMDERAGRAIKPAELLDRARQWLPEYFEGVRIEPGTLSAYPKVKTIEVAVETSPAWMDAKEDDAVGNLEGRDPEKRVKGLSILAEIDAPDLFDWCAMFFDDESADVRVAALRTTLSCEEADAGLLVPHAESEDKMVRAVAIACLARHSGDEAPGWFRRGLEDPEPCVRVETAALLARLDPAANRPVFELALHDPNPDIERRAKALTAGKGYAKAMWSRRETG